MERHHIGNGSKCHKVGIFIYHFFARTSVKGADELKSDANAAKIAERSPFIKVRIYHRRGIRQCVRGYVMIGNDHVYTKSSGSFRFSYGADTVIDRYNKGVTVSRCLFNGRHRNTVAVLFTVRHIIINISIS